MATFLELHWLCSDESTINIEIALMIPCFICFVEGFDISYELS